MIDGQQRSSLRTITAAAASNLIVALAKLVAALLTGSAALWAETAHSFADTGNELLLYVGLRRSRRTADDLHPFGYGHERFFFALLASLCIFVVGGLLSIAEGLASLLAREPLVSPWIGMAVLVAAAASEGYSWRVARRQLTSDAGRRRRTLGQHLRRASDPSAPTVYFEDSAALVGVGLAMSAIVLDIVTGETFWDGGASIGIGVLLIVVAVLLARRSKALLTDETVPVDVLRPIEITVANAEWVARVESLVAVFVGPGRVLVLTRVIPTAEALAAGGSSLVDRVTDLRRELLGSAVIAEAAVTVARLDHPDDSMPPETT